jgi:hypothetical protein
MLNRTYPSECSIYGCDDLIISAIRDKIGDRSELKRYYVAVGGDFDEYVPADADTSTFSNEDIKFWPYSIKVGGAVCSGVYNPQVVDYHYLVFEDSYNLTASGIDFWVESFKLSDYEIWTAYLSVDLSSYVNDSACITDEMEILKAAIDLIPSIRVANMGDLYTTKEVVDKNTSYRKTVSNTADPYGDLLKRLQKDLDYLIELNCTKKLYQDGIRIE